MKLVNGKPQKNGGNVASYFCTPDGLVIHAVGRPVSPAQLLAEAQWAVNTYEEVYRKARGRRKRILELLRTAHEKHQSKPTAGRQAHMYLAKEELPSVARLRSHFFSSLAGQKFVGDRKHLYRAAEAFEYAQKRNRPVALLIYQKRGWPKTTPGVIPDAQLAPVRQILANRSVKQALDGYVLINVARDEMAALSSLIDIPLYEMGNRHQLQMVIAAPDGSQLGTIQLQHGAPQLVANALKHYHDAAKGAP